jgi:ABC-type transporter Mla MlaB component
MLRFTEQSTQTLRYYLHNDPDAFRMELAGSLTQPGAESAYQAWRTALPVSGGRPVIVDISFVNQVDQAGRDVLLRWHKHGASIIARSPESRALADGIASEPAPLPPPQRNWGDRLRALLVGDKPGLQVKLLSAIRSSLAMVAAESCSAAAWRFSRRWPTEDVPGISRILGAR